jgi:hypothetical protein
MNPPLERLAEQCGKAKGRDGQFSRRLGDIVERYEVLIKLTPLPELTAEERMILGTVICGSTISHLTVKYMDESVLESGASTKENQQQLAEKIRTWSIAERLAVIDSLGV